MLSWSLPGRIFSCTLPTDMGKGFDTLAALVQTQLGPGRAVGRSVCFARVAVTGSRCCAAKSGLDKICVKLYTSSGVESVAHRVLVFLVRPQSDRLE